MDSINNNLRLFEIECIKSYNNHNQLNINQKIIIEWSNHNILSDFILKIRQSFNIEDNSSFILQDTSGCTIVLSDSLPSGIYNLIITKSSIYIDDIIKRSDSNDDLKSVYATKAKDNNNFERNYLRLSCADALIANERTWLAWTRTSLNIMTCCFTFVFLSNWSNKSVSSKFFANLSIIAFSISFAGCFIVGYIRYRMFAHILRTSFYNSDLRDLEKDVYNIHRYWAYYLGFTLFFSSVVYLEILRFNIDLDNT